MGLSVMLVGSVCAMELHLVRGVSVTLCKTSALEEGSIRILNQSMSAQVCDMQPLYQIPIEKINGPRITNIVCSGVAKGWPSRADLLQCPSYQKLLACLPLYTLNTCTYRYHLFLHERALTVARKHKKLDEIAKNESWGCQLKIACTTCGHFQQPLTIIVPYHLHRSGYATDCLDN